MAKTATALMAQDEAGLAARAAWLHFVGGLTQGEVAERLGLSATRAHRAIAKAQAMGLVHVWVDPRATGCVELENRLIARFGLSTCRVAAELPEPGPLPLRALGAIGGDWLGSVLDRGRHEVIGISHGRTLAAAVEAMRPREESRSAFVSLLGGLTRSLAANPYDVIHRLAQKSGAEAYLMPAPLFTDTAADKAMLLSQSLLRDVLERMRAASLAIVGVGELESSQGIAALMGEDAASIDALRAAGARAEILGQFLNAEGAVMATPFDGRAMALPLDELRGREVVAIAGGASKASAIQAALKSGILTGLIIDEATARGLVGAPHDADVVAAE
ncbi:MAG: sugar-binding transcriptional regulator [Pseudomonadota bacterium]